MAESLAVMEDDPVTGVRTITITLTPKHFRTLNGENLKWAQVFFELMLDELRLDRAPAV